MVIQNLAFANATDGLNAFFTYLPDSTLDMMSPSLKSTLNDVENIYWGTASSSNVTYGTTNDTVYGLGGNDTLHGDGGNDIIYGGKGNDVLYGDADNDILIGENGNDTLYGGAGADTFVLTLQNSNFDTVKDFNTAETDKLDLSNILTAFDPLTQSILDYVSATSAGGNTTLLVDADGAGAGIARTVAVLEGVASFDVLDNYNNGTIIV
jgi:Ca2+-binding RTX toxin-like protein